jgi:TetR/AcrR family transcriptional regulator, tetracycline repressor protein
MAAPAKLKLERILDEAIILLRDEGLDKVTLRALAARLDVEAPSLYRHIGSKEHLLALVTLRLFRQQLDRIGSRATWQDWLMAFGRELWATQSDLRDCARLVLNTQMTHEQFETMSAWASLPLIDLGIDRDTATEMHMAVQAVVLGFSGIADGPNAAYLRRAMPFDTLLEHAVEALVRGWEARLSSGASGGMTALLSN